MNMQQTCDPDRLDAFVRGELSEQQESELTAHLDQCAACGEEMERRVAEADQWREAGELLTHGTRRSNVVDLVNDPSTNGSLATSTAFAEQMDLVVGMLAPTDDPEMLGRIGSYEVSGVIGCGGMGVVFKAHDRSLDRVVAIKVMAPHLAGSGAARKRFARESKAAAAVLHPNVIAIHCVADDPTLPYLVMPYIGGTSLQKRVEADGPLCTQDTLRIGQQIAAGLAAAHAQGLVHRDIKPANILLERGVERVTITDFGLARAVDDATMTRSGVIAGTPQYMSPEQARGESIDHRSDLFSLGSVLYMMCAGHSPFRAETTFGILRRITDNQPRPLREIHPDVPEWLCAIIEKLHAKEPSERFQSAEEVAELLEGCLAHVHQPTSVPLPASLVPLTTTGRSVFNVTRKGVLMMLVIFGMTLLGMVFWQATEPPDISGQWTGDEWGTVVLEAKGPGQYEGTFTDSVKGRSVERDDSIVTGGVATLGGFGHWTRGSTNLRQGSGNSGTLNLKWSRPERRFNGTWRKGDDSGGKISLRLVDHEIRGAWTTGKNSQKEPESARLSDLFWKRIVATVQDGTQVLGDWTPSDNTAEEFRQLPSEDATISISEFKKLNEAKQVAWLKEAVKRFREETGNISATVVMSTQNFEYEPTSQQRSTVLLMTGHTHNYQIRRIDHSYRVRHTQQHLQHKDNGAYTASIAHWDAAAGRLRQRDDVRSDSGDHMSYGTIRPERDDIAKDCFFLQYLGDNSHEEADAIPELWNPAGRYLQNMDHARVVEIRDLDSAVKIAFPCKMPWGAAAESELIFDLAKGGLLIEMNLTELAAEKDEFRIASRRHRMTMTQPVLVEEVWLPTKFEMTAWSQNYPKQITVFKGKVSDIQLNKLTAADLEVVFPPGVRVSDAFSGERYVVPFDMATASDTPAMPSSTLNKEVNLQTEFPLIAWDFEYPLLGRRMAKLRVSKDFDLESVFPGRQTVKGKAPEAEVKELIELIALSASVDDGLQYQNTVSRIAEFDQLDTSVRTERVAVNRAGRILELQLNKSLQLDIENRLWRLEGIVAIGGQDALTDLIAIANQQLQTQFPEIKYKLTPRDFLFGIMEDSGTRIVKTRIPVNKSESTNTTEMNFTLTVPASGEPKLEQEAVTNSADDPAPPKTLDKSTREMDSPKIYTAKELIANGMDLLKKQEPVTVRFKVASVRRNGVIDPDGKETQHWFLSSEEYKGGPDPKAFQIQVSMDAEKSLERSGVKDIAAHFNGQELIIVGKVSISGLELEGSDAIWFYSITLERLDQLHFVKGDGNSSLPQKAISESAAGLADNIATESKAPALDHRNARSVVEAYVAAALAGDVEKAASLAKNSLAKPKHIRELPEFLNVQRLKIETVYINDPAKPTQALATSVAVKLGEEHKNPDDRRDGFMVFTLEFTDGKWFVIDIDFETESEAEKELNMFLEANPNSFGIPPQS